MTAQSAPAHQRTAKELVLHQWEVVNSGQLDRLGEVFAEDVVVEWPQSRERVRGVANLRSILANYPGGNLQPASESALFLESDEERFQLSPMFKIIETDGYEDSAVGVVKSRYPDGTDWFVISIVRALGGKIVRSVQYFAPLYDPPKWREPWVEYTEE